MRSSGGWLRKTTLLLHNHDVCLFPSRSEENESAEIYFCENHQLNLSTLRMTAEAKVGLHLATVRLFQVVLVIGNILYQMPTSQRLKRVRTSLLL